MLNKKLLNEILAKYDVKIKKYDHFILAMSHSSYANEHNVSSNERIEFLGDAVLGMLVARYIYENFPFLPEGKMSKLRATYVCENANAKYAKELQIDKLLLLGRGEELSGGRQKDAIINDAFESFLGALYLTNGLDDVKKVLEKLVFPHIKANDQIEFIDYKSLLQEYVQSETRASLVYKRIYQPLLFRLSLKALFLVREKADLKKKHRKQPLKMLCRKLRKNRFFLQKYTKNDEKTCKRINNVL